MNATDHQCIEAVRRLDYRVTCLVRCKRANESHQTEEVEYPFNQNTPLAHHERN